MRKDLPFAGYGIGQHHIEGREAIGGDDQHVLLVQRVQVANFTAMQARQAGKIGFIDRDQGLLP